ncbi:Translation initiation factor 2B subunit, eIF-2B alpha/beta/delta family [Archaeoglobus sulfaticallidus PM70-1]|uniref:Translation initiation factor 2B subunit, eIF-2B alpha/beta/delta family n=1 Tax=Archaeoglobus sulfaticallidus PM70-1 TaxID=387631 RepID=N0BM16_9EURY|nr:translation initiation factor 2B subunit, eIF-2B alpha/beta/delta family [Archaeoglobus sulfaticallidus]AGK61626.1 Translation initiation factor 2B subunit, eIF-2B alpha/beta/delta family [Archaeoglobus sulfaticallidus PM70-1]
MDEELEKIISDREHGSSYILIKSIELLKKYRDPEIVKKIISAFPEMSGLKNILNKVAERGVEGIEAVERYIKDSNQKTSRNLREIVEGKVVTTISRSHIVSEGLKSAKKVFVLESNPGGEGRLLADELELVGVEYVEVVPDAFMGYAVAESDYVISGADSISKHGFVNKVGTLPLALVARHYEVPFILAVPSYKFSSNLVVQNKIFEFVSMKYVSQVVSEICVCSAEEFLKILRKRGTGFKV